MNIDELKGGNKFTRERLIDRASTLLNCSINSSNKNEFLENINTEKLLNFIRIAYQNAPNNKKAMYLSLLVQSSLKSRISLEYLKSCGIIISYDTYTTALNYHQPLALPRISPSNRLKFTEIQIESFKQYFDFHSTPAANKTSVMKYKTPSLDQPSRILDDNPHNLFLFI
jgi:hypothetical protein